VILNFGVISLFAENKNANGNRESKIDSLPYMSFIMNFSHKYSTISDVELRDSSIPTFMEYTKAGGFQDKGFNIDYLEVSFEKELRAGYFLYGNFNIIPHVFESSESYEDSYGNVEMKEVFFHLTELPAGFLIKGGRFLSSFGRFNQLHEHEQTVNKVPLLYFVMFGESKLLENGIQFIWAIPVPFKMEIGGEVLEGDNQLSFGTEQIGTGSGSVQIDASNRPNLFTLFFDTDVRVGPLDVGLTFSGAYGNTRINHELQSASGYAIEGTTFMGGSSLLLKYWYSNYQFISLESEFMIRSLSGTKYEPQSSYVDEKTIEKSHYGFYTLLNVQPLSYLQVGLQFSWVMGSSTYNSKTTSESGEDFLPTDLYEGSAIISYVINSLTKFRVQYNYDLSKYNAGSQYMIHEVTVDLTLIVGQHDRF
jgi:hypothetical protein